MFKKKKEQPQQEFNMRNDYSSSEEPKILHRKTIKELIAPAGINALIVVVFCVVN